MLRLEAQLSDPIAPAKPPRWPSEAAELVALAVSDGDLGAAVAQYDPAAALRPWAGADPGGSAAPNGRDSANGRDSVNGRESANDHKDDPVGHPGDGEHGRQIAETMAAIMRLRLPLDVRLVASAACWKAEGLTMLVCERRIAGQGPDGQPVSLRGVGCTVVRPQDDGSWRIAADAWQLADNGGA